MYFPTIEETIVLTEHAQLIVRRNRAQEPLWLMTERMWCTWAQWLSCVTSGGDSMETSKVYSMQASNNGSGVLDCHVHQITQMVLAATEAVNKIVLGCLFKTYNVWVKRNLALLVLYINMKPEATFLQNGLKLCWHVAMYADRDEAQWATVAYLQ